MKLIILVAIVLVVLVLGGGAAYLTLFTPSPKQDVVVEEKEPERDPDDFVKLALQPFTVPVTSRKNTFIGVDLTFADESAAEFAGTRLPRLRSAILEELYEAADKGGKAGGVRDFEALSESLTRIVADVVGKEELVSVAVRDMTKELSKKPALPIPEPAKKKSSGH